MNNSRKNIVLAIALLCAITLLACDLGGGVSGTQPPPTSGTQPPPTSGGQAPAAPSGLRVTSTTKTTARIAWDDKANNEDGFEIEIEGKLNPKIGKNETQSDISGLQCGKANNFRVRAFNGAGNSQWSNQVTAQTLACDGGGQSGGQVPAAPANLRVTSTTKTTARLAWDDKSNNEDGFEIESPGKQYPKTAPNETQSEITGLECGKAYNFKVRAFNEVGNSAYSNEVTAQTLACDAGGQQPPTGFRVVSATASVTPATYTGACPPTQKFKFSGVISVNGPGTVTYVWAWEGGTLSAEHSINFTAAGSQTVTEDWPANVSLSWTHSATLSIHTPNVIRSDVAKFIVTCQ